MGERDVSTFCTHILIKQGKIEGGTGRGERDESIYVPITWLRHRDRLEGRWGGDTQRQRSMFIPISSLVTTVS